MCLRLRTTLADLIGSTVLRGRFEEQASVVWKVFEVWINNELVKPVPVLKWAIKGIVDRGKEDLC